MAIDRQTRDAISQAISKGMMSRMETYEEVWVTGEQLCARMPMFSKEWLKRYGRLLPRERVELTDAASGTHITTRFMYPLHKLQRMTVMGELRHIVINP